MTLEPSSASPNGESLPASSIMSLQGACPICGETVVTIEGNTVTFSQSHVTQAQDSNGKVSFTLYHSDQPPAMHPGTIDLPAWIVVESLNIRPLS